MSLCKKIINKASKRLMVFVLFSVFTVSCAIISTGVVANGQAFGIGGIPLGSVTMVFSDDVQINTQSANVSMSLLGEDYNGTLVIRSENPPGPYPPFPGPLPPSPGPFPPCPAGAVCNTPDIKQQFSCSGGGFRCPDFPPYRDIAHEAVAIGHLFTISGNVMSCRFYLRNRGAGFLGGGTGNCRTLDRIRIDLNLVPTI